MATCNVPSILYRIVYDSGDAHETSTALVFVDWICISYWTVPMSESDMLMWLHILKVDHHIEDVLQLKKTHFNVLTLFIYIFMCTFI